MENTYIKKCPMVTITPKTFVRSRQGEHHLLNLKSHATAVLQLKLAMMVLYTHWNTPRSTG